MTTYVLVLLPKGLPPELQKSLHQNIACTFEDVLEVPACEVKTEFIEYIEDEWAKADLPVVALASTDSAEIAKKLRNILSKLLWDAINGRFRVEVSAGVQTPLLGAVMLKDGPL